MDSNSNLIELEHAIGYNGNYLDTVHYHPELPNILIYNIGGLIVIEDINDAHNQSFLRFHDMPISSLAVSGTGNLLASGQVGSDRSREKEAAVVVWDFNSKKPIYKFAGMRDSVQALKFSPDDRFLAGIAANNKFIIWDCNDGNAIYTKVTEQPRHTLSWGASTKQGRYTNYTLVTAQTNAVTIHYVEFDIGSMQYIVRPENCQLPSSGLVRSYTHSVCDESGQTFYACTTGSEFCVFSLSARVFKSSIPTSSNGLLCLIPMDDYLFAGSGDGKVKKLQKVEGKFILQAECQLEGRVASLSISSDNKELICGTSEGLIYRVLTSDLSNMVHAESATGPVKDISFGSRSDRFSSIDDDGALRLWDLSEYRMVCKGNSKTLNRIGGASCCIAEDETIVTGWEDGFMRCFAPSGQKIWEIANAHRGTVTCVYADANYILSGGSDGAVRVWARKTHEMMMQFAEHTKNVTGVIPDFEKPFLIHSASIDKTTATYDLKLQRKVVAHQIKNGSFLDISQRKDNEYELVTCGQGGYVLIWDCDEVNPVGSIDYAYKLNTCRVSPDGNYLALGSETGDVLIYNIKSLEQVAQGDGHSAEINRLEWSTDQKQLVSVAQDNSIFIWNFYA